VLAVIAFAKGWVWTRAQVADLRADRDMWRDAAQKMVPLAERQLTEAETTNRLLRALPGIPGVDR
jgi:glutamate racemase